MKSTQKHTSSLDEENILHLNDDCIYQIYKFLPTIDWCSLRETCTRFRTISDYCFRRQSESFQLTPKNVIGWSDGSFTVNDVKRVIRNFGQFITKISINRGHFHCYEDPAELVRLLDRYCNTLQDLKFVKIDLTAATIKQCARLFSNLHRLVIDQSNNEETFNQCLPHCVALKELELIRLRNIKGICLARYHFEFLESFTVSNWSDFNHCFIKLFLLKNRQIKRVKLLSNSFEADRTMEDVVLALPNLMELSVKFNFTSQPNLLPASVTMLPLLKKFEMDFEFVTDEITNKILDGLAVHNNMEDLHIASFRLNDESIPRLCALKTLKILKLTATRNLNRVICKKLASELSALSEIHIVECPDTTFNDIKEFVVHSTNLQRIVFNRIDDTQPSLNKDMFLSLVEAWKKKENNEILLVFLNDDDLAGIRDEFEWNGKLKYLFGRCNIVKLLPLEKEHRGTVYEYGSQFMGQRNSANALSDLFDFGQDIDDDDEDDDFDDTFDDDFDDYHPQMMQNFH